MAVWVLAGAAHVCNLGSPGSLSGRNSQLARAGVQFGVRLGFVLFGVWLGRPVCPPQVRVGFAVLLLGPPAVRIVPVWACSSSTPLAKGPGP